MGLALVSRVVMDRGQRVIVRRHSVTMLGTIVAEGGVRVEPRPMTRGPHEGERDDDGNDSLHDVSVWNPSVAVNRSFPRPARRS